MLRAFLFTISAAAAIAFAAGGAEAKAPCKDAKGRVIPCPQKDQPAPPPSGGSAGSGCMALMISGTLVPCYVQ
jgi:hypothetical protein